MRSTGLKYLHLGEEWRQRYLHGSPIIKIALEACEDPQTVSRAIWLAKVPADVKEGLKAHPEIFTRRILLNAFAAKRRQCEKEDFALLRSEVNRLILEGAGSQPKLKKTKKINKTKKQAKKISRPVHKDGDFLVNPLIDIESTIEAEYRIKQALGYACRVAFDKTGGGEVRIFFKDKKALNGLIETFEPFSKDLF
jgi:hypothetical protein